MIKRLQARLTYANVMATVAVFLAIGGGVTLAAVSGSGSVKFGAEKGLNVEEFETVLSLPGIGQIQAGCFVDVSKVRFKNTSGETLQATAVRASDASFEGSALADGRSLERQGGDPQNTFRFHVFKADPDGTPAADVTVGSRFVESCAGRTVTAQAISSE
jgi:hypothetical protein